MAKQIIKWASNLITVLMFLVLITLLFYTISSKMNGGKPHIFGYELLTVLSGSMEPSIPTGSIIGVKPVSDVNSLQVGDVITYKAMGSRDMLITHRIVEVKGDGGSLQFITKGDNNDSPDSEPIPASRVVAKYENIVIPYLGYVFSYSKTKVGIILMMIVPGVILVLSQVISVWRMIANMDDKVDESNSSKEELEKASSNPSENFS